MIDPGALDLRVGYFGAQVGHFRGVLRPCWLLVPAVGLDLLLGWALLDRPVIRNLQLFGEPARRAILDDLVREGPFQVGEVGPGVIVHSSDSGLLGNRNRDRVWALRQLSCVCGVLIPSEFLFLLSLRGKISAPDLEMGVVDGRLRLRIDFRDDLFFQDNLFFS